MKRVVFGSCDPRVPFQGSRPNPVLSGATVVLLGLGFSAVPGLAGSDPCSPIALEREELPFTHRSGASPAKHLPETMGAGVAWVDWDGDGWWDLYLVQSGPYPGRGGQEAANVLLRNVGGTLKPRAVPGADESSYGQGVLAVDVDGDRDPDLIVTNVGPTVLLRNEGERGFRSAPLEDPAAPPLQARPWGSSAAAADGDGDGDLDLYVSQYLDYDPEADLFCGDVDSGVREYCDPSLFEGLSDRYWRNLGDGRFEHATEAAGLGKVRAKGLGVLFVDLDQDLQADLYVANDLDLNLLYRNRGDGTFEDVSLLSGAAVDGNGKPEAGMGLTVSDFDQDGDPDLAVANFDVETNTLYRNLGGLFFEDVSAAAGFAQPSFNRLGFGVVSEDLDLDGVIDVFVANGHIFEHPKRENVSYRQPALLLRGLPGGRFEAQSCSALDLYPAVARGAAAGDLDNDGDGDIAVSHNDDTAILLRNRAVDDSRARSWLGVELVGRSPNTEAIGAVVTLRNAERIDRRWVIAGRSYQSSADRRLRFAVPEGEPSRERLRIEVTWPSGHRQRMGVAALNRYLRIHEPETR